MATNCSSSYAEEGCERRILPLKRVEKANKTARGGTPPRMELLGEQIRPLLQGSVGDDDAMMEQILDNQGAIGELVKKTSSMEGSLQKILSLLEGKRSEGYDDDDEFPRGRGTTTTRVKGQRGPSARAT